MKDRKYELTDLDTNDKVAALVQVLLDKHIISTQDLEKAFEARLKLKNEALEKYLEENPAMNMVFDMLPQGGMKDFKIKGDQDE
jgi:CTP synthase (UTP-ammonia lyase)